MARGDLGAATTTGQLVQLVFQRQGNLRRIPTTGETRTDVLTMRQLNTEAFEAQGSWPLRRWIVVVTSESIARFLRAATGA